MLRRSFLTVLALGSLLSVTAASAADYPNRPVRWVVPYPPGGATDIMARLIGHRLSEKLGQQFVIENKPGAGNNIGTESVVNAPADGYTVLLVNPANAINASLYAKLNFNFIRDIAPVAGIARVPNVMTVNPEVPAKTVAEFIAYAKANPGKINMASSGNGTSVHLSGEMFKAMTGVEMQHVPYRGSAPAMTDLIAGQVQVIFDNMPSVLQHIKAGKLRALAVTTAARVARIAGCADGCRDREGLRGERLVRHGCAEEHAEGDHRDAQQGDQRDPRGAGHEGAPRRTRRRPDRRDAGRVRQGRAGRDRQVGEGRQVRRRQGRIRLKPRSGREDKEC